MTPREMTTTRQEGAQERDTGQVTHDSTLHSSVPASQLPGVLASWRPSVPASWRPSVPAFYGTVVDHADVSPVSNPSAKRAGEPQL